LRGVRDGGGASFDKLRMRIFLGATKIGPSSRERVNECEADA
jgi:hypothetical protein